MKRPPSTNKGSMAQFWCLPFEPYDGPRAIAQARQQVNDELAEAAMINAAGVIANFQRMVRIADGTGVPLTPQMNALTADLRSEQGINGYGRDSL